MYIYLIDDLQAGLSPGLGRLGKALGWNDIGYLICDIRKGNRGAELES